MEKIIDGVGNLLCTLFSSMEGDSRIYGGSDEEPLQVSLINNSKGVLPHKHTQVYRETWSTQEVWVLVEGRLAVNIYGLSNEFIKNFIMSKGNCAVFYRGGHSFVPVSESIKMYEIKNGPYFGVDKINI